MLYTTPYYTILHMYSTLNFIYTLHYAVLYAGYSYTFLHGMGEIRGAVEGYGDSALKEVAHVVSIIHNYDSV